MNAPRIPHDSVATATKVSGVIVEQTAYDRAHADGELGAALSMLDHATRALAMGTWHLERALAKGSGEAPDLNQLERLSTELAEIALRTRAATSLLTAKVGRP